MRNKNTRKGFTTVELVIVIAVIAILATVLIPTFSNLINQANLSTDKQNVRNMNMVLLTYMIEGTEDFGDVRNQLLDGGYKTGEKFLPKTEGYRYLWYSEKNVVLLVNTEGEVEYPEEYIGLETRPYDKNKTPDNPEDDIVYNVVEDIRLCFDLNLPAATIKKDFSPDSVRDKDNNELNLAVKYTFTASDEGEEYDKWIADFYISLELSEKAENEIAANGPLTGSLAGQYEGYQWTPINIPIAENKSNVPLVETFFQGNKGPLIYNDVQMLKVFNCGVVNDVAGDADQGTKLSVELRLTEARLNESTGKYERVENGEEKVLGIFTYTYK